MKHLKLFLVGSSAVIGLLTPSFAAAKTTERIHPQTHRTDALIAVEQSQADRQREAERTLKEAEEIRRENSSSGSDYLTPETQNLDRRTNDAVDQLRNSFGNERELRESKEKIERLRQERLRLDRNQQYQPDYPIIIPIPIPYGAPPAYSGSGNPEKEFTPQRAELGTASVSFGFKNGTVNPAVGYRFSETPISIEIGAVFNQDTLPPGALNDYSVPSSLLQQFPTGFDNLGRKNLTPQIGADILGHLKVTPTVSLYGGVGLYFQGQSDITRSNVTTDLFKQTSNTDVSVAVSGGADVKIGDSFRIGGGYHSLRGITAKIGIDF
jgi:Outer membrane protein beta-barrel domain